MDTESSPKKTGKYGCSFPNKVSFGPRHGGKIIAVWSPWDRRSYVNARPHFSPRGERNNTSRHGVVSGWVWLSQVDIGLIGNQILAEPHNQPRQRACNQALNKSQSTTTCHSSRDYMEVSNMIKAIQEYIGFWEVLAILIVSAVAYKRWTRDPRLAHLPPHVRGWPIINQTLDQMKDNPIPNVINWAQKHGELFTTTSGTSRFIWVNSRKAFKELIDRRSAIYSSRHAQPMVNRASGGKRMVFMPYGRDWRAIRNIIHRVYIFSQQGYW